MFGKDNSLASSGSCAYIWKKSLFVLVGIVFLMGMLVSASYATQKHSMEMQAKENVLNLVEVLEKECSYILLRNDTSEIQNIIKMILLSDSDIVYIYVTDINGDIILWTISEEDTGLQEQFSNSRLSFIDLQPKKKIHEIIKPIKEGTMGTIHIGLQEDGFFGHVIEPARMPLIYIVLLLIAIFFMAYVIKVVLLRPIDSLNRGLDELNKGNFSYMPDMRNNTGTRGFSGVFIEIGTKIQKLVREIEETSRKVLETRNYLDVITSVSNEAIFVTDEGGWIEYGNERFLDLCGSTGNEIIGKQLEQFIFSDKGFPRQMWQNNVQNYDSDQSEAYLILQNGAMKPVLIRHGHVELNGLKKLVCLVKDISEIRIVDEMKNNIISNISHELRTPLTIVKGFIEIASEEDNREKRSKYLQRSLEALKRQEWMIEDLLEVAMDEEDVRSIIYDSVYLYDVIEKAIEKVLPKALETDIHMRNQTRKEICVKADPDKLCYAMTKLLDNAVKFNMPGEDVVIEAACSDDLITVKVTDRGIGIQPEDLGRIFDHFYQIDPSTKRRYSGNGLGLSIAKRIIERHGGRIWVESEKNKGSTFFFTLHGFSRKTL
ncbi:ATP-binding protein [Methanomethylovorans sp.]|uniref:sensor histidine kinase n=1 Tax=Methanomethylovorans sp. TaxID=2758717 RepID=UPI00351C368B